MSKTIRRGVLGMAGLVGGLGALLLTSPAFAIQTVSIQLTRGVGGPYNYDDPQEGIENGGAGQEQIVPATIEKDGKTYVVLAYMSSDVDREGLNAPNQIKCTSFELTASGPVLVADQVYLTQNQNTDRPGNKPALYGFGKNLLFGYGYAPNNGNTRTYVRLIDERCNSISDTLKVSNNDNQNIGAAHITPISDDRFFVTYYSNNGNQSRGRFVNVTGNTLTKGDNINLLDPSNIGRAPVVASGNRVMTCTGLGNQRPPEQGMACTLVDADTETVVWKNQYIVEAQGNIRYNQSEIAKLADGRYALLAQETNSMGKDSNDKGSNRSHVWILEPNDQGPGIMAHTDSMTVHATHAGLVAGAYGENGETVVGVFEGTISNGGPAIVTYLRYDTGLMAFKQVDTTMDRWIVSTLPSDSGMISNLYGNNPNTQGRNFFKGMGDVKNPGYGVAGGFMEEAETLFVMPYTGKSTDLNEPKLAAYLTFLPGKTKVPASPTPPEAKPKDEFNPNGVQPQSDPPAQDPQQGMPAPEEKAPLAQNAESSGGCNMGPTGDASSFAAIGLAIAGLLASRRRKES